MTGPCLMRLTWFQSYFDIMWMCMTPAALTETTVVMHIYRTMVFTTGSPQFDHYASCKSVSIIFIEIFLINGCCNVGAITCRQLPHPRESWCHHHPSKTRSRKVRSAERPSRTFLLMGWWPFLCSLIHPSHMSKLLHPIGSYYDNYDRLWHIWQLEPRQIEVLFFITKFSWSFEIT